MLNIQIKLIFFVVDQLKTYDYDTKDKIEIDTKKLNCTAHKLQ